jgi:hypothetical protein
MQRLRFNGHDCVELQNENLSLVIAQSIGPRILSLKHPGGANLLAELPDFITECEKVGTYHFYGGHRLWHAPEDTTRSYIPDNQPVELTAIENGVKLVQTVEQLTGIQKSMEITLSGKHPQITIKHEIHNQGLWPIECAAWAITQLRPGGVVILPLSQAWTNKLPNRSIAIWPYTDMSSPMIHWRKDRLEVQATISDGMFKIGFPNPRGWLAYWSEDTLFVKRAAYFDRESYCDMGSSSECYINDQFIELETLSPMRRLEPGDAILHVETWELHQGIACPETEEAFHELASQLGLE